jgi:hypothetical protein
LVVAGVVVDYAAVVLVDRRNVRCLFWKVEGEAKGERARILITNLCRIDVLCLWMRGLRDWEAVLREGERKERMLGLAENVQRMRRWRKRRGRRQNRRRRPRAPDYGREPKVR